MINVLIADDYDLTRLGLRNKLTTIDPNCFDIEEAENGVVALRKLYEKEYNLLLLDWEMPKKGGFEVVKEITNDPSFTELCIIILSAHEKVDLFTYIKNFHHNKLSCIHKPYREDLLKRLIITNFDELTLK